MTDERMEMLPGWSSVSLDRFLTGPFVLTGLAVLPFPLTRFLENLHIEVPSALLDVAGVTALCFGIPSVVLVALELRRRANEERAGYTLFRGRRLDLPLLDPKTGIVLRAAAEPNICAKVYRQRLAEARSTIGA